MVITVNVKPGSKKGPLVVAEDNIYMVYLRERPHDGEANTALIHILADYFHIAKSCIVIKSGSHSHHKLVEILN